MTKIRKKEVRKTIEDALHEALAQVELTSASKKIKKVIRDASREIGDQVAEELKKKSKKIEVVEEGANG
jgi:hypothetical protein